MFSSDKSKQKKRRSVETNVSHSSTEKPIHQEGSGSRKRRSHSNLLNVPLHSPGSVQNASVNHETAETPDYQNTSYTDKLSIAIQMVPDLLVGDVKETLEKLLHDPAFTAELVAVGAVFVGLQATPAGPFIDAAMVATLGVDVALKLGGFLYKSYTAQDENDLKAAAEDLKGFIEVAGLVGATKLLGMAGRTLKKLSGEATAVEGQTVPHGELRDVSGKELDNIWGGARPNNIPLSSHPELLTSLGAKLGKELHEVADGRNPFEAFKTAREMSKVRARLENDAVPFLQEIGPHGKNVYTGMKSPDGMRGWRIDFDPESPTKGFHINWWFRQGPKRKDGWYYGAVTIKNATKESYQEILNHFPRKEPFIGGE
jgi:hypothetical protein